MKLVLILNINFAECPLKEYKLRGFKLMRHPPRGNSYYCFTYCTNKYDYRL